MTVKIIIGDVRAKLAALPDNHFDCVCTSPPYWGLRDYGTATWLGGDPGCSHLAPAPGGAASSGLMAWGTQSQRAIEDKVRKRRSQYKVECRKCGAQRADLQIGLEATLEEHIEVMVAVMREIRRVLKPTGTLWLNYGDCYVTSAGATGDRRGRSGNLGNGGKNGVAVPTQRARPQGVLKPKDLAMAPNRLAIIPEAPRNAASFLMARSIALIDRARWPVLVTYADSWRGHTGAIYKATGWAEDGQTAPEAVYTIKGRMVARKAGGRTRTHGQMLDLGAVFEGRHAKTRFVMRGAPFA